MSNEPESARAAQANEDHQLGGEAQADAQPAAEANPPAAALEQEAAAS